MVQSFSPDVSLTLTDPITLMHWTKAILPSKFNLTKLQMKQNYIKHWEAQTQKQSKMQCYLALKRQFNMADYPYKVTDKKLRATLSRYRLSGHKLAIDLSVSPPPLATVAHSDKQMELLTVLHCQLSVKTDFSEVFLIHLGHRWTFKWD